jgi:hypothetical protein
LTRRLSDLFIVGMKSYGRAPTFLMLTGYEQARSVVSAIAGDWESARRVELILPETGVCSVDQSGDAASSCCGTVPDAPVVVAIGGLKSSKQSGPTPPAGGCC